MVDKITSASKPLEINDTINDIIDNLGHGSYDQTYKANSTNAQSGKAVSQAISTKQNILTGANGITVNQVRQTVELEGTVNNYNIFNDSNAIVTGPALYQNVFNKFPNTSDSYLIKRQDTIINGKTSYGIGPSSANIGDENTPVYFENGVPKPCSSTVVDTRFDGPWVDKNLNIDFDNSYHRKKGTNVSINSWILDYLDQTTPLNYAYLVTATLSIGRYHSSNGYNTYVYIYDHGRNKTDSEGSSVLFAYADGSKTQEYITSSQFVVYPDSDFYISVQGTKNAKDLIALHIYLKGYRRLGTNQ